VTLQAVVAALLLIPLTIVVVVHFWALKKVGHFQREHLQTLNERQRHLRRIMIIAWVASVGLGFGIGIGIAGNVWFGALGALVLSMIEPLGMYVILSRSGLLEVLREHS
jgi:purine-cytosine permease-like protein